MNNPFNLKNKNILISGASSGIGRQCAISCSEMGANIILLDRDTTGLDDTINKLKKADHLKYSIDLTIYDEIEPIISDAVKQIGRIDGFIHSAGIERTIPLRMMTTELYRNIFDINVFSAFEIAKILSKKKYRNDNCSFIFIASIMGVLGQSGKIAYSSSKGALISGMKSMALELCDKGIRVNTISPAMINTPLAKELFDNIPEDSKQRIFDMHPMGIGETVDVANTCIYLLSDASKWVTGSNLILDGGYSAK